MKTLKDLLHDYTVRIIGVQPEDGGGFKATYEELAISVKGYGQTLPLAVTDLEEVALDVLANESLENFPAPHVESAWPHYSGRLTLRVPKVLHAQLDRVATEQGVSLNHFMDLTLQSAVTALQAGKKFGAISRFTGDSLHSRRVS